MPSAFDSPMHDPLMSQFDKLIGLVGYGLLIAGLFSFGVPSMVAFALALAHRRDAHPIIRSHYRHQTRIFAVGAVSVLGAGVAALIGSGTWLAALLGWIMTHLGQSDGVATAASALNPAWFGGIMLAAALGLLAFGAIWTLVQSVFGFLRLAADRPIGHTASQLN